jgi:3-dehydroquinate dehydratase-1
LVASVVDGAGLRRVLNAKRRTWDVVEIRADRVGWGPAIERVVARLERSGVPVIVTVRAGREGGLWQGATRRREAIYKELMRGASAVDIELQSSSFARVAREARRRGITVIGSFHQFVGTPSVQALEQLARRGWQRGADIVKVATSVRTAKDVQTLMGLLRKLRNRPICVIGMSEVMPDVRIKLARAGSYLAYGHVGRCAAPGQLSCGTLRRALWKRSGGSA